MNGQRRAGMRRSDSEQKAIEKLDLIIGSNENENDDESLPTLSSEAQSHTENLIVQAIRKCARDSKAGGPKLNREACLKYSLPKTPGASQTLDASGPWLCYWMVHSVNLLGHDRPDEFKADTIAFLNKCQHPDGGYGGGYLQVAHLASTYAAVLCLISLGTEEAYNSINRQKLYEFLLRMHQSDGSYSMHEEGEIDSRGAYCALSVAKLTNILDEKLAENVVEFLVNCQSYEGGFGARPGVEAHGGYSFCGIAALAILNAESRCDLPRLLHWLANRQYAFEGGFSGRTNKLVDCCYSFWQGAAFPIVYKALSLQENFIDPLPTSNWIFDQRTLQEYLLVCCQSPGGGLRDKPDAHTDYYHTCYGLSGLSIAQHFVMGLEDEKVIVGGTENLVETTDPVYNVRCDLLDKSLRHFGAIPLHT